MGKWRYGLKKQHKFYVKEFDGLLMTPVVHEWFTIGTDGWVYIKTGYAWNGATFWPDGPRMENPPKDLHVMFRNPFDSFRVLTRATLYHDWFYQFLNELSEITGISKSDLREIADLLLFTVGIADGAEKMELVLRTVRLVGGLFRGTTRLLKRIF